VGGMDTIIGRFITPLNSSRMAESPSLRDDISRAKMQNVRMDCSVNNQ
jgi:hypothetical protein